MLLTDTSQQYNHHIYAYLCAVIHVFGIAAFLHSTDFDFFLLRPVENHTVVFVDISAVKQVHFHTLSLNCNDNRLIRCRSPPSDFDFAYQLKIEIGG